MNTNPAVIPHPILTVSIATLLLAVLGRAPLHAASKTWDGGGADNNWQSAANWDLDTAPVANDMLMFDGSARLTTTNNFAAGTRFDGITFPATAGAFTLGGNQITLGGNLIHAAANTQLINLFAVLTAGDHTFDVTTGGIVNIGAPNTSNNNRLSGAGGIIKEGGGELQIDGRNSYTGNITVNGGTLRVSRGPGGGANTGLGNVNTAGRTVTVNSGATLLLSVNDQFGNQTFPVANLPSLTVNGGILSAAAFNQLGEVALNSGATLTQSTTATAGFQGFQFLGTITVGGSSPSLITRTNANSGTHLGANTTFNVGDVTGDGAADLTVSTSLRNQSQNYNNAAGNLTKAGAGTMLLTDTNVYTGSTSINAGTLALASSGSINNSPTISVAPGATFDVSAVVGYSLADAQVITNDGTVLGSVTAGAANRLLKGNGTYANDVTIGGGAMINPGTTTGTVAIGGNLTLNTGGIYLLEISGANADRINVTGTASFLDNSQIVINQLSAPLQGSYTVLTSGGITGISAGLLTTIGRTAYSIDATALANNTIQLNIGGAPATVRWKGTPGNSWNNTQASLNWINGTTADSFFDGDFVTFNDTDNGATNYSVDLTTTVSPGSVTINNSLGDYTFGVSAGTGISGIGGLVKSGTSALNINGNHSYTGATVLNNGAVTVNGSLSTSAITLNGGSLLAAVTNTISGSAALTVNDGIATLSQPNTYSGGTILNAGTLNIGSAGAIGTGPLTISGGTFDNISGGPIALGTDNVQTWNNSFVFTGSADLDLGTGAVALGNNVTVAVNGSTLTAGGAISGLGMSLTKTGTGTLQLGINSQFSAGLNINAGTLIVSGGVAGASGRGKGVTTVEAGATLIGANTDAFGAFPSTVGDIVINGGTVTALGTGSYRIAIPNLKFTGGTLTAEPGNLGDANGNGNYSFLGVNGACLIVVSAANTTASITAPIISLQSNTTFDVADGTDVSGIDLLISSVVKSFGTGTSSLTKAGNGVLLLTGENSYRGHTIISAGSVQIGDGGVSGTLGSGAVTNNATLAFNRSDVTTVANAISGSGTLRQIGVGTLILTGANTSTGQIDIAAGILQVGNAGISGSLGSGLVVNESSLVFDRVDEFEVTNAISGAGAVQQNGLGTVLLTGANTYMGATTVNAGKFIVGNGVSGILDGTASVSINSGSSLGGSGSITTANNGSVTLASGAFLEPGITSGTLTLSLGSGTLDVSDAISADASGALRFELGVTASDKLLLNTGALNIGSGVMEFNDFTFTNAGDFGAGTYLLFDSNAPIIGSLGLNVTGNVFGLDASLEMADGGRDLVLVVVPEPASIATLLTALGVMALRRRRTT